MIPMTGQELVKEGKGAERAVKTQENLLMEWFK
jgi:hypothetical protein